MFYYFFFIFFSICNSLVIFYLTLQRYKINVRPQKILTILTKLFLTVKNVNLLLNLKNFDYLSYRKNNIDIKKDTSLEEKCLNNKQIKQQNFKLYLI